MRIEEQIRLFAARNAVLHNGKAAAKPVLSSLLSSEPDLRSQASALLPKIEKIVKQVNTLSASEQESLSNTLPAPPKKEEKKGLPELEDTENLVMRFAPSPSGPLHIGHARTIVLNGEYVKRHKGKFILRLEDTNPKNLLPDAYKWIPEDVEWLGYKPDETVLMSSRLKTYHKHAEQLIERGLMYLCTCTPEKHKALLDSSKPCPCRSLDPGKQLKRWEKMFSEYKEGDAVCRVKTDLSLSNPALRDWPALRICDTPHPKTKSRHRVWPLYNFSVAIDDHEMKITHILRGKDHLTNTQRQAFLYQYFQWRQPWCFHHGRLKIGDLELSTTKTKEKINSGEYTGWDDIRLGTLRALRARGIEPGAIRNYMLSIGLKPVDITLAWKNLFNYNRTIIEPAANRYLFVPNPKLIRVEAGKPHSASIPVHPQFPKRGKRTVKLTPSDGHIPLYISSGDLPALEQAPLRLMDLFNIELHSKDTARILLGPNLDKKIHWVSEDGVEVELDTPDGKVPGKGEKSLASLKPGTIVQFIRVGYAVFEGKKKNTFRFRLAHP